MSQVTFDDDERAPYIATKTSVKSQPRETSSRSIMDEMRDYFVEEREKLYTSTRKDIIPKTICYCNYYPDLYEEDNYDDVIEVERVEEAPKEEKSSQQEEGLEPEEDPLFMAQAKKFAYS